MWRLIQIRKTGLKRGTGNPAEGAGCFYFTSEVEFSIKFKNGDIKAVKLENEVFTVPKSVSC